VSQHGGRSAKVLLRTIKRLRSDDEADVSLAAFASEAVLSRLYFCRAFKESTGLSPLGWLRQYRLEQAVNMLRDTDDWVVGGLMRQAPALSLEGDVVAVAADRGHHFSKPTQDRIVLVEGHGVEGDAHAGPLSGIVISPVASPAYPISGRST
jgi:AraC-like DNA-binding protein